MKAWGLYFCGLSIALGCFWFPLAAPVSAKELKAKDLVKLSLDELLDTEVVTASRTQTPLSKVSKSISVVGRNQARTAQQLFWPELIDDLPGVYLKRYGGPGRLASIGIRGAGAYYTQYQYNGLPLRDASEPQTTFNAFVPDLYLGDNIAQAEVLRGTHSTLYGSQAMGGVINFVPQKWNQGLSLEARSEFGEHQTLLESGRLAYGTDQYYLDLNPLYMDTNGIDNGGPRDYYYEKIGFSGGAGLRLSKSLSVELSSLISENEAAFNGVLPGLDDQGRLIENQASGSQYFENGFTHLGLTVTHQLFPQWEYRLKGGYTQTERVFFWSDVSGDSSEYNGETQYAELQHNLRPLDWLTLTLGVDYEKAEYEGREPLNPYSGDYSPIHYLYDWEVWDLFANVQTRFLNEHLLIDAGMRYNHPQAFDPETLWELSGAYILEKTNTKLHGHVGTGYRTPSLYESFGGYVFNGTLITIGNPELDPEESISYEAGVDQFLWEKRINLGMTWFRIDFDNLIIYDMMENRYENAKEARTEGVEAYLYVKPVEQLKLGLTYTHAEPEYKDTASDQWKDREYYPKDFFALTASVYPSDKLTLFCRVNWQDDEVVPLYDTLFNQVRWEEDASVTVDMAVSYQVCPYAQFWLRAENLLDEEYTEGGFTMPGSWWYCGLRLSY